MKTKKITTLEELNSAAMFKRSVIVPQSMCWNKPTPAAFVINLPGREILNLFYLGIFQYEPRTKGKRPQRKPTMYALAGSHPTLKR